MEDFVNDEHEDIIINDQIEENDTDTHYEVREISIETENEDAIHIDITENETETNMDTYKDVIDELPDDTSIAMMQYCVNNNLDDTNKKYWLFIIIC